MTKENPDLHNAAYRVVWKLHQHPEGRTIGQMSHEYLDPDVIKTVLAYAVPDYISALNPQDETKETIWVHKKSKEEFAMLKKLIAQPELDITKYRKVADEFTIITDIRAIQDRIPQPEKPQHKAEGRKLIPVPIKETGIAITRIEDIIQYLPSLRVARHKLLNEHKHTAVTVETWDQYNLIKFLLREVPSFANAESISESLNGLKSDFEKQICNLNSELIEKVIKHFTNLGVPVSDQDLRVEGEIATIYAIERYDSEKGSFSNFARQAILWRMETYIRVTKERMDKEKKNISLDEQLDDPTKDGFTLHDVIASPPQTLKEIPDALLESFLPLLTPIEQQIVILTVVNRLSLRQIAPLYLRTFERIRQHKSLAFQKIKAHLEETHPEYKKDTK